MNKILFPMKKVFLICLLLFPFLVFAQQARQKTILVVLAHPDDETAIGAVIAKLTKENKVILLTATDGRYGVRQHAGNIKGDSLAAERRKELQCSCKELRIDSLIHLNYHDGMGGVTGVGEYFKQTKAMREEIKSIIEKITPDLIITFGPDGDTGHSDHRNIGNIITEIILRETWVEKYPLYYLAWKKEQSIQLGGLGYMADEYINVAITFTDEEEQANWKATKCHWSQFTEKEIQEWVDLDTKDKSNTLYFRRFVVAKGMQKGF